MHRLRHAGLALVLAVSACAAPPPNPGQAAFEAALSRPRQVSAASDMTLPFDAYQLSPDQMNQVDRAVQRLTVQCMSRFGLRWRARVPNPVISTRSGRYGLIDPAVAAEDGYHPPSEPAPGPAGPPIGATVKMVYFGTGSTAYAGQPVPNGGCLGESRAKLRAGAPPAMSAEDVQRLQNDLYGQAQADPRVTTAMSKWRECMAAAGYAYPDIWRANDDPRWSEPKPSRLELATATADVGCKQSSKLTSVWLTTETAYEQREIAVRQPAFDAVRRGIEIQLGNARTLLSL